MSVYRRAALRLAAAGTVAFLPMDAEGQDTGKSEGKGKDSLSTAVASKHYGNSGLKQTIFGAGWRDVWGMPVQVPPLVVSTHLGGLKVLERGGGFQSMTLHLQEEKSEKEHRFRSVNKFPLMTLPPSLRETAAGRIVQDQVSALFPGAPLMAAPLLDAIKSLHVDPKLYVLADDPRLGVWRDSMAGMLGTVEEKANEGPNDEPGFGGSKKIVDSEDFFKELRRNRENRFDEEEFLAQRLVDLVINDGDRTPDNSDFARFGDSTEYRWRAIPLDRDWAFMDARGLFNAVVTRSLYPKTVSFGPEINLKGLTYSTHYHDRRLLQRLTRDDFAAIAHKVQAAITDDVIEQTIAQLPVEWREKTGAATKLRTVLRARRDAMPAAAMQMYRDLAVDVDIYGTDKDDVAKIVRHQDGSVTVTIGGEDDDKPKTTVNSGDASNDAGDVVLAKAFYSRTFIPAETEEVRVYLLGGEDKATITGARNGKILVRLIGGYGDDVLADSAGAGKTYLYDSDGKNELIEGRGTHTDVRPWREPVAANGMRLWTTWRPDWGGTHGFSPAGGYKEGAGLIVGVGYGMKEYGFRSLPYRWSVRGTALVGTSNGRVAVKGEADYRPENSALAFTLAARASQLDAFRFYGYGNNTPRVDRDVSLVDQTVLSFEPAAVINLGWRAREISKAEVRADALESEQARPVIGRLEAGPIVTWIDPSVEANSPLSAIQRPGNDAFGHVGVRAALSLDRTDDDGVPMRGWKLSADVRGYPPLWDLEQSFTRTHAEGSFYVPLVPNRAHLAVRGGATMASGLFPAQYSAAIGGWSSLRGYSFNRFSGDASADGSAELRVPVGTVNLLMRWNAGLFALTDVGRVWMDGESDGNWHTGVGGGFWLSAFGKAVSFAYAKGDQSRFYIKMGLF